MSGEDLTDRGLPRGTRWSELADDELPIVWSVDTADGPIQGPLALEFLRGRRLALELAEGQMALLIGEGRLRAVFLAGQHDLEIGSGEQRIAPDFGLVFLTPGEGLSFRWTAESPLRCGADGAVALIGGCRLDIDAPTAFHDTFLAGVDHVDPAFVLVLIDRLIQGAVAARLVPEGPGAAAWTPAAVQARLTGLGPADVVDELAPCGLVCRELAVYTAQQPVEKDGSRQSPRAEADPIPMSGHSEDVRRH